MKPRHFSIAKQNLNYASLALACALLAGCGAAKQQAAHPAAAMSQALPVGTVTAQPVDVPINIEEVGQTEGSRQVEVRARVGGILEKWLYKEGSHVRAGAPLFQIERAPYEIALQQARAALAEQQAKVAQTQREARRLTGLAKENAASQKDADDAVSAAQLAEAALKGAQAQVRNAQLNLSYTLVRAPVEGVTGRALLSEGTLVTPAQNGLLTTIDQLNPIWVRFSLSESDEAQLKGGRLDPKANYKVSVVLPDGSVYPLTGHINFTASTIDPKLGTIGLRAELPNPKQALLPGQFVRVRLEAGRIHDACLIPQQAVQQNDKGAFVFVVDKDGKAAVRPVVTGNWQGSDWIILKGLNAGDQVITDNFIKLRPGVPVKPVTQTAAPAPTPAK